MHPKVFTPSVIDVEASGFGSSSYPIEVGVALDSGARFSVLIRPQPDWSYWDARAEDTHRITQATLKAYGQPIHEVANELNSILRGHTVYSDCWVTDQPWLNRLFHTARVKQEFKVRAIEMILSEAQLQAWDDLKIQIIQDLRVRRHRASYDALIIQQTYLAARGLRAAAKA